MTKIGTDQKVSSWWQQDNHDDIVDSQDASRPSHGSVRVVVYVLAQHRRESPRLRGRIPVSPYLIHPSQRGHLGERRLCLDPPTGDASLEHVGVVGEAQALPEGEGQWRAVGGHAQTGLDGGGGGVATEGWVGWMRWMDG